MDKIKLGIAYTIWAAKVTVLVPYFAVRFVVIVGPRNAWLILRDKL